VQQSIDISCLLGPQQQTCLSSMQPDWTDRQMGDRPCCAEYVGSANKQNKALPNRQASAQHLVDQERTRPVSDSLSESVL